MRVWITIVGVLLTSVVCGQEVSNVVKEALARHEEAVTALKQELDVGFRSAIKVAANSEQLAELRTLLDAREDFLAGGDLPTMPAMTEALGKYTAGRKESAVKVVASYRTAMEDAAKRLMLEEAQAVKREMNGFINAERVAIGLPFDKALDDSTAESGTEKAKVTPDTGVLLEEFIANMQTELERVSKLETSALRVAEHRKLMERLDLQLSRRTLVFHFPIEDVTDRGNGSYDLDLGSPPELKNIQFKYRMGDAPSVRLKPADALSLGSGHAYEIRGKGRLGYGPMPPDFPRAISVFAFESPHIVNYTYAIYVWDYKTDIKVYDASSFKPELKGTTPDLPDSVPDSVFGSGRLEEPAPSVHPNVKK